MHYNFISYLLMVSHLGLKGILLIVFANAVIQAKAIEKDSIRHWGFTVSVMKSEIIALDKNQRKYLKEKENGSVALELNHINLPSDHDSYAKITTTLLCPSVYATR